MGQPDAVSAVSKALRRAQGGLKDPNRPIAALLFSGPTGVGKTELTRVGPAAGHGTCLVYGICAIARLPQQQQRKINKERVLPQPCNGVALLAVQPAVAQKALFPSLLAFRVVQARPPNRVLLRCIPEAHCLALQVLADQYFGSPDALLRLDMSEYMERHSVAKLIGAPPGAGSPLLAHLQVPVKRCFCHAMPLPTCCTPKHHSASSSGHCHAENPCRKMQ